MPGDRFIEMATAEGRHVLDVLFRFSGEAVTVQDRTGNLVYANTRAAEMVGFSTAQELMGTSATEILATYEVVDERGNLLVPEALPGRMVLDGAPMAEAVIGYRRRGTQDVSWSTVRASPIKNDAGEVVWAINYFLDISDEVQRGRRDDILARLQQAVGSSLDPDEIVDSLIDFLVPELSRAAAVHLLDDAGFLRQAKPSPAPRSGRSTDPSGLQARVMADGASIIRTVPGEEALQYAGPWLVNSSGIAGAGEVHVACLPIRAGDWTVGTLTIAAPVKEMGPAHRDTSLLTIIADRAGVALGNALLFSHEHEIAEILQRDLTPDVLADVPGFEIAVRYKPQAQISRMSGDFYDVVPTNDGRYVVFVGDIEGKGITAAARVGSVRHTLRATLALDDDPETAFRQINDMLLSQQPPTMCTLAYLSIGAEGEPSLTVTLAGHPPPIVVSSKGDVSVLGRPCPPLGVMDSVLPLPDSYGLSPGDTVLVYTDGFAIAEHAPPETLMPLMSGAHGEDLNSLLDRLLENLLQEQPDLRDDVVLLALRAR